MQTTFHFLKVCGDSLDDGRISENDKKKNCPFCEKYESKGCFIFSKKSEVARYKYPPMRAATNTQRKALFDLDLDLRPSFGNIESEETCSYRTVENIWMT